MDLKLKKNLIYYILCIGSLGALFLSGILCLLNGLTYSPTFLGLILIVFSTVSFINETLDEFSEKYLVHCFPMVETYRGRAATYLLLGLACFIKEAGWLGCIAGISMLFLGVFAGLIEDKTIDLGERKGLKTEKV